MNETVYRILVSDIYDVAKQEGLELDDEVVDRVCHKLEAMDFGDLYEVLKLMIEDAIEEVKQRIK